LAMAGGDQSVRDHRQWWTDRVASVAYAPAIPRPISQAAMTDEAPMAGLVATIGPRSVVTASTAFGRAQSQRMSLLFALLALALFAEIASRRLRGAA
jgi:hypothetical protein